MIQADPKMREDLKSMNNIYVRTASGMAPINEFVTMTKVYGPQEIARFNLFTSIDVNATAADGYSSGDAIRAIEEVASNTLPTGFGYEFSGLTRSEQESSRLNDDNLRSLSHIRVFDSECAVRELPRASVCYLVNTVRYRRRVHIHRPVRKAERHLHADRAHHAYRTFWPRTPSLSYSSLLSEEELVWLSLGRRFSVQAPVCVLS